MKQLDIKTLYTSNASFHFINNLKLKYTRAWHDHKSIELFTTTTTKYAHSILHGNNKQTKPTTT